MKAGKDGPMKKNFPGAFKISNFDAQYEGTAQGRMRDIKPMNVDIDGNPVQGPGPARRNYSDEGLFQMKSPKKAKAKKAATGEGIGVYNDQGVLHAKYNPGDMGYDQALMMLQNQSPNQMKSPKKAKAKKQAGGPGVAVYNDQGQLHAKYMPGDVGYDQAKLMAMNTSSAMNMKSPKKMKAKAGAKKDAIMDRKSAMKLKKKSANKLNPGFDKLPKDVQAKIMKKKK